jgi:tetratricopeptide (TPR) repeat protein
VCINHLRSHLSVLCLVLAFCAIMALSLMMDCATAPPKPAVSMERQKAKQDSLRQIWDRNLKIAWSTGFENHKNKLYQDALKPFWRVAELDTVRRFPDLYTYLGDCYIKLNKLDSAEIVFRLGTKKYQDKAYYQRSLAWLLVGKKQSEEAIEHYHQAIAIDPNNAADFKALGALLVAANLPKEALPIYQKLIRLDPTDNDAQRTLSQIHKSLGNIDAALQSWEKALESDPNNTTILMKLGETYFKEKDYPNSIKHLTVLTNIKPTEVRALELLSYSYQNLGRYSVAIPFYQKIIAMKPDDKKVLCEMASCYKELKQFSKARSVAAQALKIDNNYGLAFVVCGEIYQACADECINQRPKPRAKYDDKLVYKLAYDEYTKALNDDQFVDMSRKKMIYIKPDLPTKEDSFMYNNRTAINTNEFPCYTWIQEL